MDNERMAVLDLDVLQPARSMVQLALDQYKSDDLFQQLLSFDSALEALDEIIDRLAEELEDIGAVHTESSDYYRTREKEFIDICDFASMIEGLQKIVREKLDQHARKLRGSNILRFPNDFPDELLLKIVNCFESTFDESNLRFDSEHPVNIRSIQSLRLTCRRLGEISSPFLVPYIHVTPSVLSLNHVERVTSHPMISRGLRRIFVNMKVLVAEHAENFRDFSYHRYDTLEKMEKFYDPQMMGLRDFGEKAPRVDAYQGFGKAVSSLDDIFMSLIPLDDEEAIDEDYEDDPDAFDSRELDLNPDLYDEMKDGLNESQIALWKMLQREHARYRELYEEQNHILRTGQLTRTVAAAAARSRSSLSLHISDEHIDPIHGDPLGLRQALREHGSRDVDHDFVIRLCGMRQGQQWEWGNFPEAQSVLYELPLAISAAGANLTQLMIETTAIFSCSDSRPALEATHEQLSALKHACRSLKTLVFKVDGSDEKRSLLRYLSALVGSQRAKNLSLDLGCINRRQHYFKAVDLRPPNPLPPSRPCAIGPLPILEPWDNLENLSLTRYSVHLNELEQLLRVLKPEVKIALDQITLLSGTWAEALDHLRSKNGFGWFIEVTGAHGSEADDMYDVLYNIMFGDLRNSVNWATRFICSGEGTRNPLRHTSELIEVLEKIPKGRLQFQRDLSHEIYTSFQKQALKEVQVD